MTPMRSRPRQAGRRGNYFLETALAFTPLILLMLGIVDVSLWLFVRANLQQSVREAVRFHITYGTSYTPTSGANQQAINCTSVGQTACTKRVVSDVSLGFINDSNRDTYVKVFYYAPDNLSTPLTAGQLPKTLADGRRITNLNQTGNLVEVRIENFPWSFMFPTQYLPSSPMTINAAASDVLQGLPVGTWTFPNP